MTNDTTAERIFNRAKKLSGKKRLPDICVNSQDVMAGDIFVAQPEALTYIDDAVTRGASVIVCEDRIESQEELSALDKKHFGLICRVEELDAMAYELSDLAYGNAIREASLVGVTGTNGKTTTAWFACGLLADLGIKVGYVGTLGCGVYGEKFSAGRNTTPENVTLKRNIAQLSHQGCQIVVLEVSSHGIALQRIAGLEFKAAVFTNLSRDHLDFHGTMEAYAAVKRSFFVDQPNRISIINIDDKEGKKIATQVSEDKRSKLFTFGESAESGSSDSHLSCTYDENDEGKGYRLNISRAGEQVEASLYVPGRFNIQNTLAAASLCCALGYPLKKVAHSISRLTSAPGRMECHESSDGKSICIDYAHTPDGIRKVLDNPAKSESRWSIFGCGGDRDKGKRKEMGAVASEHSDHIVICDDNVRTEVAEDILIDVLSGIPGKKGLVICRDRNMAFDYAMQKSSKGDVIYLLGKGNESHSDYGVSKLNVKDTDIVNQYMGRQ